LQLAASLKTPVDLLAQARIVAVDVVGAAIAQPAPVASRHAAATVIRGSRARLSPIFMLTSSVMEDRWPPLACHQFGEARRPRLAETRDYASIVTSSRPQSVCEEREMIFVKASFCARRRWR
jgi:hypothetical protein